MTAPAVTNTLANGNTVDAPQLNTNFSDLVTYVSNRNDGTATWDMVSVSHATNIPLLVSNSTGTQNIARFQDNATTVLVVEDGGHVTVTSNHATDPTLTANNGASTGAIFRARDNGSTVFQVLDGGVCDFVNAAIALGGGSAPTLGTIGGSGPATAGQNSWWKVKIAGTDSFVPIWR